MPRGWTSKDERQYEHIKESERDTGRSPRRAKQIAAATVNKRRSEEGRTKSSGTRKKSSGTGKKSSRTSKTSARSGRKSSGAGRKK
jgi:hypothetical protein